MKNIHRHEVERARNWQQTEYLESEGYHLEPFSQQGRVLTDFGNSLPQLQGGSILDIGCSIGLTTKELAEMYPSSEILGVDINANAIEIARRERSHGKYLIADIYTIRFDGLEFQAVFAMNNLLFALEDTKDPDAIAAKIASIGKLVSQKGYLLLSKDASGYFDKRRVQSDYLILRKARGTFKIEQMQVMTPELQYTDRLDQLVSRLTA